MPHEAKRPHFIKRHKVFSGVVAVIVLFVIIGAAGTASPHTSNRPSSFQSASSSTTNTGNHSVAVHTPAPPPACTTYQALDSQSWLEIIKDPTSHQYECYTVYGEVTQFDSVTGASSFLADVGGVQQTPEYGFVNYPTTTYLTGNPATLQPVVQQDIFTANVMILGTETYKSVTGAQLTVPALQVNSIQVTGTAGSS